MTPLSWLSRQIYEAGANNKHFQDVRKAAFESTKAAVRRLSIKCAQESASSGASKNHQKSKKTKSGQVHPEMRYIYRLLSNHTQATLSYHQENQANLSLSTAVRSFSVVQIRNLYSRKNLPTYRSHL